MLLFSFQFRRFETELGDEFGDDVKVVSDVILSTIVLLCGCVRHVYLGVT